MRQNICLTNVNIFREQLITCIISNVNYLNRMNTGDAVSLPTKLEVQEFRVFNPKLNINDNVLNVAYGVDENYLFGVGISMASVILNNQNDVAFHIICDEYPEDFLQKSELLANEHNISISLYKINVKASKPYLQLSSGLKLCILDYLPLTFYSLR